MKKIIYNLLLLSVFTLSLSFAAAQTIPIDSNIRKGNLDNGLTYYIKHNAKPEKKVELRLVVNAGSILEDDDQQGLAHFMEHMNFNGTKNFPKNKLVDYLQSIGVRFGNDLNAYTSFDETVYMLPIPLDKPDNLTKGLQVIEDWAFNALMADEEIDKERGIILEELRMGLGANQRMRDKLFPTLFYNSHYAERLPIGKKNIIETCPYDALRRFYHDWYRPDLMAVIVVGDINVDEIEKHIKEIFGKYKNPEKPRPRIAYEVPDHAETLVAKATDKEAQVSDIDIYYSQPGLPKIQIEAADYNEQILDNLLFTIINNRLQELADSPNPPFTQGYVAHSTLVRTKEIFACSALTSEGKQLEGMKALLQEIERAKRFGVTESELDRAKNRMLSSMERAYNDRDKTNSESYVSEYMRNFLEKEPIPGITWEYNQFKTFIPTVTLEQINAQLNKYTKEENRVVAITGPEKEGLTLPGDNDVLAVFDNAKSENLTAYDDQVTITQLVTNLPAAGKIKKVKRDKKLGTTTWTLSNGATVIIKKTDFKNDEIRFAAERKGGKSLLSDADYRATQWAYNLLDEAGVNGYSKTDLTKYLEGKQAGISSFIGGTIEGFNAATTPKDLPTLMELIYASFTGLNYDEPAYKVAMAKMSSVYDNLLLQPQYYFMSELNNLLNKNNPRYTSIIPTSNEWATQDFAKAYQFVKDRFANAGDFTFYFVGNVDETQLKDLAVKYLATLPASKVKETFKDNGYRELYTAENLLIKKGEDPKSMIVILYSGEMPKFDVTEEINFSALNEVVDIKMVEILREKEGGVYSSGASASYQKTPYNHYSFALQIPTGPEQAQKMTDAALEIIKNIIENGPEQKDVDKFKEESLNQLRDGLKNNGTWMNAFRNFNLNGGDKYAILKSETLIKSVTVQSIQQVAKKYLTDNHRIIATLMPENVSK
ncbi:MAG: insulinase family protein [Tannerella sp.]|jgi:zinc protease|nr:insulinase family protein [Tannerella sp.]